MKTIVYFLRGLSKIIFDIIVLVLERIFNDIPKQTFRLLKNKSLLNQPSFYPEVPYHKSKVHVFFDQIWQIIKYGTPEQFYFMYGFDTKKRKEMNEYMHLLPFMKIRNNENLSNKHNASCILRNKIYFGMFAEYWGMQTGRNVGIIVKDGIFLFATKTVLSVNEFSKSHEGSYFCKVLNGECGNGIFTLDINKDNILLNGKSVSVDCLSNTLSSAQYLIQERVVQHKEMSRIYPGSLNTIRLVTIKNKKNGSINVFPSNLRIGAHGSFVDNGSQGGIGVGVHLESGKLFEYGLQKPPYGTKTKKHPDTGVVFADFTIPYFNEAKQQALFLHSKLDGISSIGWDIAITENGPLFIEGNDNWELQAIQRTHGGLKKEFLTQLGLK